MLFMMHFRGVYALSKLPDRHPVYDSHKQVYAVSMVCCSVFY